MKRHHAAGVHAQHFAGFQLFFHQRAAGMQKHIAVAFQFLQDKALAAKQAGAQPALKGDAQRHTLGGAQKGVFLRQQRAAEFAQVHRHDFARRGGGKGHALFALAFVDKHGGEHRFAGEQALAGAKQLAHPAAFLRRAVAEHGVHADAVLHIHHGAGFADGGFAGVELHFDKLQVVADDFVVNHVHGHAQSPCWAARRARSSRVLALVKGTAN